MFISIFIQHPGKFCTSQIYADAIVYFMIPYMQKFVKGMRHILNFQTAFLACTVLPEALVQIPTRQNLHNAIIISRYNYNNTI